MALYIRPTDAGAAEELTAYVMAYPALQIAPDCYYVFDVTDAPMYSDMEHNAVTAADAMQVLGL